MTRTGKRSPRVKYTGESHADLKRAIYGKFYTHPILSDAELALGLGIVSDQGDWSIGETLQRMETARTRASLRVGRYFAGCLRRGDFAEIQKVVDLATLIADQRWGAIDELGFEIKGAERAWHLKNKGVPSAKDLARLIDERRATIGGPALNMSLGALTMQMIRKKVRLKGRRQKARHRR